MASTINADNGVSSGSAGLKSTADSSGVLALQTNGTTAISIDASQAVTFSGAVSLSGNQTTTGNLTVNGNTTLGDASTDTVLITGAPSIGGAGLGMGMGFRNRIINGAMMIDQRNAGASVTPTVDQYIVDRWFARITNASKLSFQQSSTAPSNFIKSTLITSLSSYSVASTEHFGYNQAIEGFNISDLNWGTASAATVSLSFSVRSSLTGTFGGMLTNSTGTRSYVFSYTINSANTFENKTVTIAGDTSGTWSTDNGQGITVSFSLGAGSSVSTTAGSWNGSLYRNVTGAVSVVGTSGATFYVTGVQLEKGSTATSFDYRPYGTELALCQRYYYKHSTGAGQVIASISCYSSTRIDCAVKLPVTMRSSPTLDVASGLAYFQAYAGSYSQQFSTMLLNSAQPNSVLLYNNAVSGFTEGRAGWLENVNASAYLAFSAEL